MVVHMNLGTLNLTVSLTCLESHLTSDPACPDATVLGLAIGGYFRTWRDSGQAAARALAMQHPLGCGNTGCPILGFYLSTVWISSIFPTLQLMVGMLSLQLNITVVKAVEPLAGEAWLSEAGHWGRHQKILLALAPAQLSLLCSPLPCEQASPHTPTVANGVTSQCLPHQGEPRYTDTIS